MTRKIAESLYVWAFRQRGLNKTGEIVLSIYIIFFHLNSFLELTLSLASIEEVPFDYPYQCFSTAWRLIIFHCAVETEDAYNHLIVQMKVIIWYISPLSSVTVVVVLLLLLFFFPRSYFCHYTFFYFF